ncbi:UPF0715 family protein [Virgibacillus necropolis]|uniref:UPF0715 family protein n=1 Tax=Virgibacillus necropolis TaxID=163877 RepID=UPI00384E2E53
MDNVKGKIRVDSSMVFRSLLCSIFSALTLSIITTVFLIDFHYIAIIVFAFYYSIFYVLFATPIQLKLNQNPKKYNIIYNVFYVSGAFIATAIATIVMSGENPFIILNFYIISILAAIVFWIFDSIFLQNN